uniref:Uncharacterized protein n=1 Tax=Sciurus vulgaris TaxID=55149 RepID=A0A8D2JNM8_SCIVU
MDTQPLVPYWDLFNQTLPLNQEPKESLFLVFVPYPHNPSSFGLHNSSKKKIFASAVISFRIALSEFSSNQHVGFRFTSESKTICALQGSRLWVK